MIKRHSEFATVELVARANSARGRTADVFYGLFECVKDDAPLQGCGLSPRKTVKQ
jgi:hypothetical protein